MRNVPRSIEKPASLRKSARNWTKTLLREVRKANRTGAKVLSRYYEKYKQEDVRSSLEKMYRNLCCYCECRVKPAAFPNIEHRKPKDLFPESTFDWCNLHLTCQQCNTFKSNKWDYDNTILDAVDDPVSEHLTYEDYYCKWKTLRGQTTIEHPKLNRDDLLNARKEIIVKAFTLVDTYRRNNRDFSKADVIRAKMREFAAGEFGSFFEYVMTRLAPEIMSAN